MRLCLLTMLSLLDAGCQRAACAPNTVFLELTLDEAAAGADHLEVSLAVGDEAPEARTAARQPGPSESLALTFGAGYPAGQQLTVQIVALAGTAVLASASDSFIAAPECTSLGLSLRGADPSPDLSAPADGDSLPDPCQSDAAPASVEDCFNDLDDDCNGTVNDGCPDGVTLGTPRLLGHLGNTTTTTSFSARCPMGSWVVKAAFLYDTTNKLASGVRLYCAQPTLVRGAGSYSITLAAVQPAPAASAIGETTTTGSDHVVDCGTQGLVGGWATGGRAGSDLDALGMACASGTITESADHLLSYSFTKSGPSDYSGYTGGTEFEEACAPAEVLIGYDGHLGGWFDEIVPVCAPLVTTYR